MARVVTRPPSDVSYSDGARPGGWWREADRPGRLVCELCPRACRLKPGDRGFCFVRENRGGEMVLATYGRSTGFCVDPIEKKPLNHFYPGTSVLSFGTAGCNLGCKFCQNWDISKSREVKRLSEQASPEAIARAARELGCRSVAFTYNDPVIWAEYAIDTAAACRAEGIKTVAVTAAYITPAARAPFFEAMDAANVDLKAFSEHFYQRYSASHLAPVLETLEWLRRECDTWVEITNLVIPRANDSLDEIRRMCDWLVERVGEETPVHFSAFHPAFRLTDRPATPPETLEAAYEAARGQGLQYVYVGNVHDTRRQSTYCAHCGQLVIQRNWYALGRYEMRDDRCAHCGGAIPGRFDERCGAWGQKRLPVRISDFAPARPEKQTAMGGENAMSSPDRSDSADSVAQRPELTALQQRSIHRGACEIMAAEVAGQTAQLTDPTLAGAADTIVMGAFVTARRGGRLRGCCGSLGKPMKLAEAVRRAAERTATKDYRLPPISATELECLEIDVSLLFGFEPIRGRGRAKIDEVEVGRHGLQIQRGSAAGLLLPSVATDHGLDAEQFLQQVCHKAGLPTTAWEDDRTRLQRFESSVIKGPFDVSALAAQAPGPRPALTEADLRKLAEHCRSNVLALTQGATPNYYLPDCPDTMLPGAAVTVQREGVGGASHFSKFSLRPGLPLQATLLNLCEAAAGALRGEAMSPSELSTLRVGVSILFEPAMHGVVAEADLRGLDPQTRALLVMENTKSAWIFDPQRSPEELLEAAAREALVTQRESASVYSLGVLSTEPSITAGNAARPSGGADTRPAAVAGAFYPADAGAFSSMIDQFMEGESPPAERWPAVLVPHAGLQYSGRIAAATLRRVQIPPTAIVIGPKHTRWGVDWAAAPHAWWALPGARVASDLELARRLTAEVPGLQLDAAAHRREHAIEIQLPLLARLRPDVRVVGVTVASSSLDRCRRFAAGLASVLQQLDPAPLLVISSDMNHFASDTENRRLDALALEAIERLDPSELYRTVSEHHISMCGVFPAVIVLETLRLLGSLRRSVRVAYATSADAGGDSQRVVGYAGMLLG